MDKGDQLAASRQGLKAAIVAKLERSKTIIDDRVEELEEEIAEVIGDPSVLRSKSEELFAWYNEPPAPAEDQKQMMAHCDYTAIFLSVLRWTCLRLFRKDLELLLEEMEKDLQKLDFARIDHHKREVQALVAHCWCWLIQRFDAISGAVESVGFRGGDYTSEHFWEDLEAMDAVELHNADLTAWAMVWMRPWAPIGDGINQVVDKFVTHLRLNPDERETFYSPDILDVMALLDIADSSMKVIALLQRCRPAGPSMFRCDQTTCGLHGFQWLWLAARGRCGGQSACGTIPKIQHIIARTLSGDVDPAPTGPEQSSRSEITHEAMKGLKRLSKLLISMARTSNHSSERAVTVRSDTQEHVPDNTEHPTGSLPTEIAISAIAEGEQERTDTEEGPGTKNGRQGSNKENQRSEPHGKNVHAPDIVLQGTKLTLGQRPSSGPQKPARPQSHRSSIASGSTAQPKSERLPPVRLERYRSSVFSLSNFAPEMSPRKMIFLNRKNLAVWRHIFPQRGSKDKRVEIEWAALERVMQASPLDFRMEKPSGNGSARTFVRIDPERGQESITLHRPHSPMIPVPYLRNWQRRFRRSLRMEAEDFIGLE